MSLYARKSKNNRKQLLLDHLTNVRDLSRKFSLAEYRELASALGFLHDIGKATSQWQKYLQIEPKPKERVPHSEPGANFAYFTHNNLNAIEKDAFLAIYYCIKAHHTGLDNIEKSVYRNTLEGLTKIEYGKETTEKLDFNKFKTLSNLFKNSVECIEIIKAANKFDFHEIKYLFSLLVDADRRDAQNFEQGYDEKEHDLTQERIDSFSQILIETIESKSQNSSNKVVSESRNQILMDCIKAAQQNPGFFSLVVPTGAGKTFSSLAFALEHAKKHNHKRIIYVIPYTSIIEQTASLFKNILGRKFVLEHHSAIFEEYDHEKEDKDISNTETWNTEIIVTTTVQLIETLFSNKASKNRKLHRIYNSTVVLDEVQQLPMNIRQSLFDCFNHIHKKSNSTFVFCSATSPDFSNEDSKKEISVTPIVDSSNLQQMFKAFKRTKTTDLFTNQPLELITASQIQELSNHNSFLYVSNFIKTAQEQAKDFQNLIENDENLFCLTTRLFPKHKKLKIKQMVEKLKNNEKVYCFSTSLIEAGVDVDFPTVFREINKLSSLIQSMGRCNREGKRPVDESNFYILPISNEKAHFLKDITSTTDLLKKYNPDDLLHDYEKITWWFNGELSSNKDFYVEKMNKLQFKEVGKYRVIQDKNLAKVIIQPKLEYGINQNQIDDFNQVLEKAMLKEERLTLEEIRLLLQYTVQIQENQIKDCGLQLIKDDTYYTDKNYHPIFGLQTVSSEGEI